MRKAFPIPIFVAFFVAALVFCGCVGPGDPETVDSIDRGGGLYERDVNGGMTPKEAVDLVERLTGQFADATKPPDLADDATDEAKAVHEVELATWEIVVDKFREDLSSLIVDQLSYDIAIDFFKSALRYELSKFDKGDAPATKLDAGSADDP